MIAYAWYLFVCAGAYVIWRIAEFLYPILNPNNIDDIDDSLSFDSDYAKFRQKELEAQSKGEEC